MLRFRLRTLFVATAVAAVVLFVGSHLGFALGWVPGAASKGRFRNFQVDVHLFWDQVDLFDLYWGDDPDGRPVFSVKWWDDDSAGYTLTEPPY
jgi:hypothetical protein